MPPGPLPGDEPYNVRRMEFEYSGSGDPARSVELLWGVEPPARRGPKPKLTVPAITRAGVALADAEGLDAVTMRRVAAELGVSAMSLYTYVPSKAELADLMLDAVYGELGPVRGTGWRERLEQVARANRELLQRHPWMLQIAMSRPVMGPNLFAKYERELRAVDGIGLDDVTMDLVITTVIGFTQSVVRGGLEASAAEQRTGMTDAQWWAAYGPALERVLEPGEFPLASRVGTAAAQAYGGPYDADRAFEFGLARLLDGFALLIDG